MLVTVRIASGKETKVERASADAFAGDVVSAVKGMSDLADSDFQSKQVLLKIRAKNFVPKGPTPILDLTDLGFWKGSAAPKPSGSLITKRLFDVKQIRAAVASRGGHLDTGADPEFTPLFESKKLKRTDETKESASKSDMTTVGATSFETKIGMGKLMARGNLWEGTEAGKGFTLVAFVKYMEVAKEGRDSLRLRLAVKGLEGESTVPGWVFLDSISLNDLSAEKSAGITFRTKSGEHRSWLVKNITLKDLEEAIKKAGQLTNKPIVPGMSVYVHGIFKHDKDTGSHEGVGAFTLPSAEQVELEGVEVFKEQINIKEKINPDMAGKFSAVLAPGRDTNTQMETECEYMLGQGDPDSDQFKADVETIDAVILKMYRMCTDKKLIEAEFGAGWSIGYEWKKKYFQISKRPERMHEKGFKIEEVSDEDFLVSERLSGYSDVPKGVVIGEPWPLYDVYIDDAAASILSKGASMRVRSNARQYNLLNTKGAAVSDGQGIQVRFCANADLIEVKTLLEALEPPEPLMKGLYNWIRDPVTRPHNMPCRVLNSRNALPPILKEISVKGSGGQEQKKKVDNLLVPVLQIASERHRFELKYEEKDCRPVIMEWSADISIGRRFVKSDKEKPEKLQVSLSPSSATGSKERDLTVNSDKIPHHYIVGFELGLDHLGSTKDEAPEAKPKEEGAKDNSSESAKSSRKITVIHKESAGFHTANDLRKDVRLAKTNPSYSRFDEARKTVIDKLFASCKSKLKPAGYKANEMAKALGLIADYTK